jgi:hypothetical protein
MRPAAAEGQALGLARIHVGAHSTHAVNIPFLVDHSLLDSYLGMSAHCAW